MDNGIPARISTGVAGLDELLDGGLIAQRCYLVRGAPGQGKTTLGLSFLAAAQADAPALFIGFQETEQTLRANANSVGIDVAEIRFLELSPEEEFFTRNESYDVFAASDVEQQPLVDRVVETVEQVTPERVFVDSLSQLRFLSADVYQFRKQVLSFLRFLTSRGITVLCSSEASEHLPDADLQFLVDGVISLEANESSGALRIQKYRGSGFSRGRHQFRVDARGFEVFPRIMPPAASLTEAESRQLSSGTPAFDEMLQGGLEAGTITLLTGPTGIGKSTLAGRFAVEAARSQRRAAIYMFEEELQTFLWRMRALDIDADTPRAEGWLLFQQVEPLRYLADEFMALVRDQVERDGVELVVLDSVTGFDLALDIMEGVIRPLHAFAKSLSRLGISVILVNENRVSTDDLHVSERDISYLSDNVIYMRYLQPNGKLEKAVGILKKRVSGYDNELRTFEIGPGGLCLGGAADHR